MHLSIRSYFVFDSWNTRVRATMAHLIGRRKLLEFLVTPCLCTMRFMRRHPASSLCSTAEPRPDRAQAPLLKREIGHVSFPCIHVSVTVQWKCGVLFSVCRILSPRHGESCEDVFTCLLIRRHFPFGRSLSERHAAWEMEQAQWVSIKRTWNVDHARDAAVNASLGDRLGDQQHVVATNTKSWFGIPKDDECYAVERGVGKMDPWRSMFNSLQKKATKETLFCIERGRCSSIGTEVPG